MPGFHIAQRAQKVSQKGPSLIVRGGNFETFCEKEMEKIATMRAILEHKALQYKMTAVNALRETHKGNESALTKAFEDTFKDSPLAAYTSAKPKHTAPDRVTHKINTAYLYEGLTAKHDKSSGTFVISETIGANTKPIIHIARNPDGTTGIEAQGSPDDKHLWLMVEYARDHSSNGKFKVTGCEQNGKDAMKLIVFGIAAGLHPETPNELTQQSIGDYLAQKSSDPKLIEMYKAANAGATAETIINQLEAWEASKKGMDTGRDAPRLQ